MSAEYISNEEKERYLKRLCKPYTKQGKQKFFINQFASGAGNELDGKFWNVKSSSRFAFDLYSWMSEDDSIINLEYEYHLPGMASGGMGPNMDVYVETETEAIFIESKFSESANLHYLDNNYLSKAYYTSEPHGRKKMTLRERYYGNSFADDIAFFIQDFEKEMISNKWHKGNDWFEPKQETCHLIGILLHLSSNMEYYKGKKIKLYNIYYQFTGDDHSEMTKCFEAKVHTLLESIQDKINGIQIEYGSFPVQDMLKNNQLLSDYISFPPTIYDAIAPYVELSKGKTREQM